MPLSDTSNAHFGIEYRRGILAESVPGQYCAAGTILSTAGRLELARVRVPQAGLATNVKIAVTTAASGGTTGQNFAALFYANGNVISQTGDQTTAWASTGLKSMALGGGPYYLSTGDYYIGFWANGGTLPTLLRIANSSAAGVNYGLTAGGFLFCSADTSLTTAAPSTFTTQTTQACSWWVSIGSDASTS